MSRAFRCLLLSALALATASAASAQASRTWVSGVGDDANPCSRTAPCKTFAGALVKTATNGEIDVLDPGGFGAVTITKSITIDGNGAEASILASLVNGVVINAAGAVVTLRNLSINGFSNGLNGIRLLSAAAVHVENCQIERFSGWGIDIEPSAAVQVHVLDTVVRNNTGATGGGILVKPGAAGSANVYLERVRLDRNRIALQVEDRGKATAFDSAATGNTTFGFFAKSNAAAAELNLTSSVATNNTNGGIRSDGALATVRITDVTSTNNGAGLASANGGAILSFGNNRIAGNGTNGAPTGSIAQQ